MRRAAGDPPHRSSSWLRSLCVGVGLVLGAVAILLIVLADSQRQMSIGILVGLWGLFLAVGATTGTNRQVAAHDGDPSEPTVEDSPTHTPSGADARKADEAGTSTGGGVAGQRSLLEPQFASLLRRELDRAFADELAPLRAEVAALRHELVEKVAGQVRLERIETTRVLGSDLEALQTQIRELALARSAAASAHEISARNLPPRPRIASPASSLDHEDAADAQTAVIPNFPDGVPGGAPTIPAEARPSDPDLRRGSTLSEAPPQQAAAPVEALDDPFAALPRLSPWTDEPAPDGPESKRAEDPGPDPAPAAGGHVGRRRRGDDERNEVLERLLGR